LFLVIENLFLLIISLLAKLVIIIHKVKKTDDCININRL